MNLELRRIETNDTINFEFSAACTLHDLRLQINESTTPSSVYLSLHCNDDELQPTLRSLGVTLTGYLIYYSLDPSAFIPLDHKYVSASLTEAQKTDQELTENATIVQESEKNQAIVSDSTNIRAVRNRGAEEPSVLENVVTEGQERLDEPLFLKKIRLEESGDMSCELVMSVHAVMLESGFLLFDQDSDMRFRFSEEISLSYTLPALIKANESTSGIETVSLKFRRLGGHMVVVYGSLGSGGSVRKVYFDKRRYVHIVGLLMETEREDTLSIHRAVLMCWRMIKDGLVTPLLIDLCYETGLKPPPCLMCLPLELKRKIVECLHGMFVARLACVSSEFRDLASDNDLWKQKCLEEYEDLVTGRNYNVVDWKEKFAIHWMRRGFSPYRRLRAFHYPLEI